MDVWGKLLEQTNEGQVRVGLFHSGEDKVYAAWVSQVIPPTDDNTPPILPAPVKRLVPEYYRSSPFSRAWMRIERIEPQYVPFFDNYSFDELPHLPFYGQDVLAQFKGKVIKSPDELRGMDTTIWSVRKRRPADSDKEIILTTGALTAPISKEAADLQSDTILHITDPHFVTYKKHRSQHVWRLEGEPGNKPTLAEAIQQALNGKSVGLVIVTGDLTFTGSSEEFESAMHSLVRLSGFLNLDPSRFVIIPGNHDIQWAGEENFDDDAEVKEAPDTAMKNYKDFYYSFFWHDSSPTLAMGRRFFLPCGIAVEVCGLNSSSLETNKNFLAGMGRIQESAFTQVANSLKWNDLSGFALRVLAIHHHLTLTEDLEPAQDYYRGFGIAVDAPRIMRMAARSGVHLVLHGHKHRAFIWRSGVYELPEHAQNQWHLGDIALLGGGSAGSTSTESNKNYFNVIDVSSKGLDISLFRASNAGSFVEMQKWASDFELAGNPPRLKLGDWEKAG
jgi:3',5'-cyclic AMP phosphodiesterase CpdA